MKAPSIYVHIPYCASKCIYCDFFSCGAKQADWTKLVNAIINELLERKDQLPAVPDTLYIGGGTPSLMPADEFVRLIDNINKIVNPNKDWKEFTIEVNPDDVTEEKCKFWKDAGVNRASMGIQSLNDNELKIIRRRHDSFMALRAYDCLRKNFSNVSVDLMFGIPFQTFESWISTVRKIINLLPNHVSAYSLMLEESTPLTILYDSGRIKLPEEDICNRMWNYLSSELFMAGYEQYEISNYSLPGFRSIHNSRYWSGNPYLGLGPSAHSFDGHNIRRYNPCDLSGYYKRFTENNKNKEMLNEKFYSEEILSKEELMEETILTRLRTREGLSLAKFKNDFGNDYLQRLLRNADSSLKSGNIKIENDHIVLTSKGIMLSNQVMLLLSL